MSDEDVIEGYSRERNWVRLVMLKKMAVLCTCSFLKGRNLTKRNAPCATHALTFICGFTLGVQPRM
jgi:hypothetical protein